MSAPPADRPQLRLDAFEAIAGTAARHDVVLEFVGGELGVRPAPDGDRGQILAWLQRACAQQRPDLDYGERVELPGLGVVLDTEELKDYSR
ncbi:hypothetical protein [Kitasatospora purpeofusca]|uniref:Uncharacterized protein n=1 Tax=Kitasatospora purpeofusca TaxID=67352 RepID=A0ABZ1U0R0_9ACTN|nr:hypothetical protein [Kitasatospora purpeofusca]